MPSIADFQSALRREIQRAERAGAPFVEVNSGELHRKVGDYPGNHRMPVCCDVMYEEQRAGDLVVSSPPKGKGASLTIRYRLPR